MGKARQERVARAGPVRVDRCPKCGIVIPYHKAGTISLAYGNNCMDTCESRAFSPMPTSCRFYVAGICFDRWYYRCRSERMSYCPEIIPKAWILEYEAECPACGFKFRFPWPV